MVKLGIFIESACYSKFGTESMLLKLVIIISLVVITEAETLVGPCILGLCPVEGSICKADGYCYSEAPVTTTTTTVATTTENVIETTTTEIVDTTTTTLVETTSVESTDTTPTAPIDSTTVGLTSTDTPTTQTDSTTTETVVTTTKKPDNCTDIAPNCESLLPYCVDPYYFDFMTEKCANTCQLYRNQTCSGLCNMGSCPDGKGTCAPDGNCYTCECSTTKPIIPTDNCTDIAPNCESLKYYCVDPIYYDFMTEKCAKTCATCRGDTYVGPCVTGSCPNEKNTCAVGGNCYTCDRPAIDTPSPDDCIDLAPNCESLKSYCIDPIYFDLMTDKCAKTCATCRGDTYVGPCVMGLCPENTQAAGGNCYTCDSPPVNPTIPTKPHECNCTDIAPNCESLLPYCVDPYYFDFMTEKCAKSCFQYRNQTCSGLCNMGSCSDGKGTCAPDGNCYTCECSTTKPIIPSDCTDIAPNCESLKYYCVDPIYYDFMTEKCAKTCATCRADTYVGPCVTGTCPNEKNTCAVGGNCYTCDRPIVNATAPDDCTDLAANCESLKSYCVDALYFDLMTEKCAKTCLTFRAQTIIGPCVGGACPSGNNIHAAGGNCYSCDCSTAAATTKTTTVATTTTTTAAPTCADIAPNCASLTNYCTNTIYYDLMTEKCAKTCGRCTCRDIADNCAVNAYLCDNSVYYPLMTTNCAKTCGRCSSPACVDSTSDCTNLSYLCNNDVYYALMTQQCPKTCGRCSSG